MKNLLFLVVFIVYVSFVYADAYRVNKGYSENVCFVEYDTIKPSMDTLKVVKDTTFSMDMTTNNPFNGKKHFVINLETINDTSYCYPLLNSKVISEYGSRGGRRHSGVDIKTRANDSIHAAFDGLVVKSAPYYGYGNCIIVRHPNGLETLYSHNSKNLVKYGDVVKAGQVIALTGRTGRATTEHLHFECRIKGCCFNPNKVFNHSTEKIRKGLLKFTNKVGSIRVDLVESKEEKGL